MPSRDEAARASGNFLQGIRASAHSGALKCCRKGAHGSHGEHFARDRLPIGSPRQYSTAYFHNELLGDLTPPPGWGVFFVLFFPPPPPHPPPLPCGRGGRGTPQAVGVE